MAEKDKAEKVLEDYNDVFADIYNTLLFKEHFLDEKNLNYGPTESIYKAETGDMAEQREMYKNPMTIMVYAFFHLAWRIRRQ